MNSKLDVKINGSEHFCWPCLLPRQLGYIVFRFIIIEYSSLRRDFYRPLGNNNNNNNNNNRSIFM